MAPTGMPPPMILASTVGGKAEDPLLAGVTEPERDHLVEDHQSAVASRCLDDGREIRLRRADGSGRRRLV
jgi:hypothetical protein